ncbi:MAG: hypothetical protein ACLVDF_01595 [Acutalibacteraceae bacterium]
MKHTASLFSENVPFLGFLDKTLYIQSKGKNNSLFFPFANPFHRQGKPRRRFSLDPFQPSKGLRPLQTPHDRNHAVPRFMSGGVEQILRDVSAPRLRAEFYVGRYLF